MDKSVREDCAQVLDQLVNGQVIGAFSEAVDGKTYLTINKKLFVLLGQYIYISSALLEFGAKHQLESDDDQNETWVFKEVWKNPYKKGD